MQLNRRQLASSIVALLVITGALTAQAKLDPLVYTIRFPEPASQSFTVEVQVPTGKRESVDLMMAIWSPGFYGIQNYADRVSNLTAKADDGSALTVEKLKASRI
jgi:predicted metalloprotease with PDZ domain